MVRLNNGSTIEEAHCLSDINNLYVYTSGVDLRTCFNLFIDPKNTERITEVNYGEEFVHTGYTELISISKGLAGCDLILRKA